MAKARGMYRGINSKFIFIFNARTLNARTLNSKKVNPEDVARLSPLGSKQINMLGRYQFTLAEPVRRGELRPLHSPLDPNEIE